MQESKDPKAAETTGGAESEDAKADATSSETLSEVEETEQVSGEQSGTGNSSMPSPDGAFDSDQSGRSPKDDPGPM
jgi:hypothetical protein